VHWIYDFWNRRQVGLVNFGSSWILDESGKTKIEGILDAVNGQIR
jgi:hypothetical protein